MGAAHVRVRLLDSLLGLGVRDPATWRVSAWAHVSEPGDNFHHYGHVAAAWAGSYCVSDGGGVGSGRTVLLGGDGGPIFIDPEVGRLVVFSASLGHYVEANMGSQARVHVVFSVS